MQVFDTPELLELILLGFDDMKTLLLSQRVHTTSRDTIKSSVKLQRALWFQPPENMDDETKSSPLFFYRRRQDLYKKRVYEPRLPLSISKSNLQRYPVVTLREDAIETSSVGSWKDLKVLRYFHA